MTNKVAYFYRHPQSTYFSIEKLFQKISCRLVSNHPDEFVSEGYYMPFTTKIKTIYKNILFTRKNQCAINHITGDIHYAIFGCNKKNLNIITIHDCVTLYRYRKTSLRYWMIKLMWFDWPVKKADLITVISENTKNDLIRFTKCDPEKIKVVSNFVDPAFQYSSFVFNKECPRILFVGTTPNKNLERLAEALSGIPAILDIVGPLADGQIATLNVHRIQYEKSEGLSEEALQKKYQECDIVAFPSTYEGFGLPIIEAQATGRPLLTSNLHPMCDVAGEGGCLVDPLDVSSIRIALMRIIHEEEYREYIIKKGLENVKRFSLDHITEQYASIYRDLIQKKF
jgi:glycosyltransferase involved in cell wall biosynthesis